MQFGDLGRVLGEHEDEVYGVCAGDGGGLDLLDGAGLLRVLGSALEDRLEARRILELLVGVGVLVGLERGDRVVGSQLGAHLGEEVERRIHAADVDQQAYHGHVDGGRALGEQLVLEDLAALAALGHGIEVDVGKSVAAGAVRLLGEDAAVILEDELEEVELDVLAPQRDAVVLFQVFDLVAAIDGRHAAVGIAARCRRRSRVVGPRGLAVVGRALLRVGRIHTRLALFGYRRVGLRGVGLWVVHSVRRLSSQNVSQAVARVGLVGARRRRKRRRMSRTSVCHDEGATRGLALRPWGPGGCHLLLPLLH